MKGIVVVYDVTSVTSFNEVDNTIVLIYLCYLIIDYFKLFKNILRRIWSKILIYKL